MSSFPASEDDFLKIKLGDVLRARPPNETNYFEGVAIFLSDTTVTVDFGDGDDLPPSTFALADVQKVAGALTLEVDDVVQCMSSADGVFCRGRIDSINADGTLNVKYEDTDDFELDVDPSAIRKVGSGRTSVKAKFKKAVNAIKCMHRFMKGGMAAAAGGGAAQPDDDDFGFDDDADDDDEGA